MLLTTWVSSGRNVITRRFPPKRPLATSIRGPHVVRWCLSLQFTTCVPMFTQRHRHTHRRSLFLSPHRGRIGVAKWPDAVPGPLCSMPMGRWRTSRMEPGTNPRRGRRIAEKNALRPLTARERQLARLIATGLTNREIAAQLGLSVFTVRNEVGRILRKLKAKNRSQIAFVVGKQS